ncbi:MAG: hypothetical protein KTR14_01755 [Vampirovibrio sp.]|nr:hypothetical protein [Vampirovibrio sp.]
MDPTKVDTAMDRVDQWVRDQVTDTMHSAGMNPRTGLPIYKPRDFEKYYPPQGIPATQDKVSLSPEAKAVTPQPPQKFSWVRAIKNALWAPIEAVKDTLTSWVGWAGIGATVLLTKYLGKVAATRIFGGLGIVFGGATTLWSSIQAIRHGIEGEAAKAEESFKGIGLGLTAFLASSWGIKRAFNRPIRPTYSNTFSQAAKNKLSNYFGIARDTTAVDPEGWFFQRSFWTGFNSRKANIGFRERLRWLFSDLTGQAKHPKTGATIYGQARANAGRVWGNQQNTVRDIRLGGFGAIFNRHNARNHIIKNYFGESAFINNKYQGTVRPVTIPRYLKRNVFDKYLWHPILDGIENVGYKLRLFKPEKFYTTTELAAKAVTNTPQRWTNNTYLPIGVVTAATPLVLYQTYLKGDDPPQPGAIPGGIGVQPAININAQQTTQTPKSNPGFLPNGERITLDNMFQDL